MREIPYTLITGASSGMGEATAKYLSHSRNLILNGRDHARLEAVAKECRQNGADVRVFEFDLELASDLAQTFSNFLGQTQLPVDAFAHFAGMTETLPVNRTKYSVGLKVMNVNYFSAVEIISTLLKKKANQKNLRTILLVSSILAYGGRKYQPHYCASKGAIISLAKALACELAPSIRVNVIAPGSFKTRMAMPIFQKEEIAWAPAALLPPAEVEEAANLAAFLLSEKAAYLTGQVIDLDGGEHFPRL